MHIPVAKREDTGKYAITVTNPFGEDTGLVNVVVLGSTASLLFFSFVVNRQSFSLKYCFIIFTCYSAPTRGMEYRNKSACLFICTHISGTTRSNCPEFSVRVALAWSSSSSIVMRYILPVLWMTSCFLIIAVASLQCHLRADINAASYWLRPVLDVGGRQDWTSPPWWGCPAGASILMGQGDMSPNIYEGGASMVMSPPIF